ncbi:MAG: phosphonate ABC transporter ATP-binding protein [Acetobacteraceae bacterium]|nr:phosphonate ABC transporter ATP-binding protein [Acetobacteraceae bacterium]
MEAALTLDQVSRRFGDRIAVHEIALTIPAGSFVGVIGRSGAGKSTVLRMINRLAEPSSGRIVWRGEEVTALRGKQLRQWRARCAMIFQQFNLSARLDVMTNVLAGRLAKVPARRSLLGLWTEADRAIALSALERFDIGELAALRADRLSGGQQQRVAIARALVQEPEIILADEPIASLDPRNTRAVMDALASINREYGITVLCNLHSLEIARAYCNRLVGLAGGHLVFDGAPEALDDAAAEDLYGLNRPRSAAADATALIEPRPALPQGAAAFQH